MAHIYGTDGNDRGATALHGTADNDVIDGRGGGDQLYGGDGNDDLYGQDGVDVLDGGPGADRMYGGRGYDIYFVDNSRDLVVELAKQGYDTVISTRAYTLTDNVERLVLLGSANIAGIGNGLDNLISGNGGNNHLSGDKGDDYLYGGTGKDVLDGGSGKDFLDGGAGGDILRGGPGDDSYIVDSHSDVIVEKANGGHDTVFSFGNYTLSANVEDLYLYNTQFLNGAGSTGSGNSLDNHITGSANNNILRGFDGNDVLDGGAGIDTLYGGKGDDIFYVDDSGDKVVEYTGQGNDTVISTVNFTLGGAIENLVLTGSGNLHGTGNALANHLTGNDWLNILDGQAGADVMAGGGGNDTYIVDNVGDIVEEANASGFDTVMSSMSLTLVNNVEALILTGFAALDGTGNELDNMLTGNAADNHLYGLAGNDILDGGFGNDIMVGGEGNDTYVVDNIGDSIIEITGQGTDLVRSSVTYTLSPDLENLTLLETGAIDGTGNDGDNILTGNAYNNVLSGGLGNDSLVGGSGDDHLFGGLGNDKLAGGKGADTLMGGEGNDVLDGGAGNDVMQGAAGDDSYYISSKGDVVVEDTGSGTDTVYVGGTWTLEDNVENLVLIGYGSPFGTGNALDNHITGNMGNNTLRGLDGNDVLDGGKGTDILYGGHGADTFVVSAASGKDTIADFSSAQNDWIDVSAYTHGTAQPADVQQVGNDAVIDLGGGNIITVLNAVFADVQAHITW